MLKRRGVTVAVVIFSVAAAAAAVIVALWATPEPGVDSQPPGGVVVGVVPGGPAWAQGVRRGQTVVALDPDASPSEWRLVVSDVAGNTIHVPLAAMEERLRDEVPTAAMAALLVTMAALRVRRSTRHAAAAAALSLVFAGPALAASGNTAATSLVLAAGALAPTAWSTLWGDLRPRSLLLGAALAIVSLWVVGRHIDDRLYESAEALRSAWNYGGAIMIVVALLKLRALGRRIADAETRLVVEAAALVTVTVVTAYLVTSGRWPLWIVPLIVASAVVVYPRSRRWIAKMAERVIVGELRDRAAIAAIEEERGRLARDLHDAPLQELAAVVRGLDQRADSTREAAMVRQVAEHLRRVTTELRPPVLEDLGLGAALAFLVAHVETPEGMQVVLDLQDEAGLRLADRPPPTVELAMFRIAQEALGNAVRHSGGTTVVIKALLRREAIDLAVEDDGTGMTGAAVRDAQRGGHLGIHLMEQRAATIGAQLRLGRAGDQGTAVNVRWRRE